MMKKFIFFFLCTLCSFTQTNGFLLTKEIVLPENINASSFLHPVPPKLLLVAFNNILIPSSKIANRLADLLLKNHQPEVIDILNVLNAGFGSNLLVVAENNIRIDAGEFENVVYNNARQVSRVLYPDNHLHQLMAYKMFQKEITQLSPEIKVALSSAKVPVEELKSLLLRQLDVRRKRDVDSTIQDIVNNIIITVCNVYVRNIRDVINNTITDWMRGLESLIVSTDDNIVSSMLGEALEVAVFFIEQSWNYTNQWWDNNNYSDVVCYNALPLTNSSVTSSERKRRDVEATISNNFLSTRVILLLVSPLLSITFRVGIAWLVPVLLYTFNIVIYFPSLW